MVLFFCVIGVKYELCSLSSVLYLLVIFELLF